MQIRCWGQGLDLQGPSEEQDGGQREKRGERDEGQEREARGESRWREERERVIEGRREERKVLDSLSGGSIKDANTIHLPPKTRVVTL